MSIQEFFKACARTDLWKSDQEESHRYTRYPSSKPDFGTLKWHILNFSSKYEWMPRQNFFFKIKKKEKE